MTDYIKREDAINALYEECMKDQSLSCPNQFFDGIERIPAADVRPVVRGKWLTKEYMYGDHDVDLEDMWIDRLAEASDYYAYCSICGKDAGYNGEAGLVLSNFCPNCGAIMDGGDGK